MTRPTLLVLAAGMGSRFGGLKQIAPLGPHDEIILDYSLYDALQAGFGDVVFVVKQEIFDDFRAQFGSRAEGLLPVRYVFQQMDTALPPGFAPPPGRMRPWGTAHAVLCARDALSAPFCVINADDFYGRDCFVRAAEFLQRRCTPEHLCMVGYTLKNTLTDSGAVSRGVCVTENNRLRSVREHTAIERRPDGRICGVSEDGTLHTLDPDGMVSMNVWGLHPAIFSALERAFHRFIGNHGHMPTSECYLPAFIDELLARRAASVAVLPTDAQWHGVTYREDRDAVKAALLKLHRAGVYPRLR